MSKIRKFRSKNGVKSDTNTHFILAFSWRKEENIVFIDFFKAFNFLIQKKCTRKFHVIAIKSGGFPFQHSHNEKEILNFSVLNPFFTFITQHSLAIKLPFLVRNFYTEFSPRWHVLRSFELKNVWKNSSVRMYVCVCACVYVIFLSLCFQNKNE